ncbi:MAG: glycosyltransferase family 39 protein [Paracoccaceae bacterium]|nr:glycosyltransferase family 39 protein [Paracoccaceae bacterium]
MMSATNFTGTDPAVKRLALPVALVLFVLVCGGWSLWEPFGRDQGIHATIAAALLDGQTTYSDVYNIKPPATTAVHALSQLLFGHAVSAIRALDLVFLAATVLVFWRILIHLGFSREAAFLAAAGVVTLYFTRSFWSRAQTDGWAAFLMVWSVWLLLLGWQRDRRVFFWLSGAVLAMAFLLKYTVATLGILIFLPLLVPGQLFRVQDFFALVFGGLAMLVAVLGLMAGTGALAGFIEIQTFTLGYATGLRLTFVGMLNELLRLAAGNVVEASLILVGLLALIVALPRRALWPWLLGLWVICGSLSYFLQGKGFAYHAWPMLLPLAACIAPASEAILSRLQRTTRILFIGLVLVFFAVPSGIAFTSWGLVAEGRTDEFGRSHGGSDFNVDDNRTAAAFLNNALGDDETLFLWGYETELYFRTKTNPVHRFPYSWPFRVASGGSGYQDELMDRLRAAPPDVLVVEHGDAVPHVTGNPNDSRAELANFPKLADFIAAGYAKFGETPRFEYYRRRP